MYLDTVVVSGLIIVVLCCVMTAVVSVYAYKKIKEDSLNSTDSKGMDK